MPSMIEEIGRPSLVDVKSKLYVNANEVFNNFNKAFVALKSLSLKLSGDIRSLSMGSKTLIFLSAHSFIDE